LSLNQILKDKGISKSSLARSAGVSPSLVTRWVNGSRRPGWKTLDRLSSVLGMSITEVRGVFNGVSVPQQ
jgi:transcriptional regulator with XRE-family HTH domain